MNSHIRRVLSGIEWFARHITEIQSQILKRINNTGCEEFDWSTFERPNVVSSVVHAVTDLRTFYLYITPRTPNRDGWIKAVNEMRSSGIHVVFEVTQLGVMPFHCGDQNYRLVVTTREELSAAGKSADLYCSKVANIIVVPIYGRELIDLKMHVSAWLMSWMTHIAT